MTTDPHFQRIQRVMVFGLPLFLIQHTILLTLFVLWKIPPLIIFNSASVVLYIFCILLNRKKHTHIPAFLAYLEISASILISSTVLGWESGFPIWIFCQTVTVFLLYKWKYWLKGLLVLISLVSLAVLLLILKDRSPVFSLDAQHLGMIFYYNHLTMWGSMAAAFFYFNWSAEHTERALHKEHKKSQSLLLNILPQTTALRLTNGEKLIVDRIDTCSILFADLVGFTELSGKISAEELVKLLNRIFCEFDDLAEKWNLEKIKTIGDAYMVAAGVPEPCNNPTASLVGFALEMLTSLKKINEEENRNLQLRIGIHTGKAVAGIIGTKKFSYDIWGDTVNTASRMESHGIPGEIQLSRAAAKMLDSAYPLKSKRIINVKGKGEMDVYLINQSQSP